MSKHDEIAKKLAKKFKTEYKSQKGIDLVLSDRVIEVEIKKSGRNGNVEKISCGKIKNLMERSYEEKCKVVGEILKKELNEHLRKMSKDKKQNRCKPEEYGKYQLQLRCDSIALENRVLMYHLFEIEEQRSKVGEGSPSPDN